MVPTNPETARPVGRAAQKLLPSKSARSDKSRAIPEDATIPEANVTDLPVRFVPPSVDGETGAEKTGKLIPSYVFDRHYYINKYVDIKEIVKSNHSFDVTKHFWDYGVGEDRRPSLQFDLHYVAHHLSRQLNIRVSGATAFTQFTCAAVRPLIP